MEQKAESGKMGHKCEVNAGDLTEIRSFAAPPAGVKDTVSSALILLGHPKAEAENWTKAKKLLSKTGNESIVIRCKERKSQDIELAAAQQAKTILDAYDLASIKCKSASAASLYAWSKKMVDEVNGVQGKE